MDENEEFVRKRRKCSIIPLKDCAKFVIFAHYHGDISSECKTAAGAWRSARKRLEASLPAHSAERVSQ